MPSTVEQLSPTRVKITVEVPFADLKPSMDKAYREVGQSITIPGFRRGKVPARIIDQRIGRGAILQEALNEAIPQFYGQAVSANDLTPLAQPEVEVTRLEDGDVVEFTAEVDVRPEFELPEFTQVAVTVPPLQVRDELVEDQLNVLRARFGTIDTVERPAEDGDLLTIDLSASRDGEQLADASAEGLSYEVGSGTMLDGLDEAVRGLSAGESATFTSALVGGPLKDTTADVEVRVDKVQVRDLPAADDEFAQMASEFDTIDELREDLRSRLTDMARLEQAGQARDAVLQEVIAKVGLDVPQGVLADEVAGRHEQVEGQLREAGLALEDYLRDAEDDQTPEQFWADVDQRAAEALQAQIILDKVADENQIGVDQNDLTQHIIRRAQTEGTAPQEIAEHLQEHPHHISEYMTEIRRGKALASVVEQASITDTDGNPVVLTNLQPDGSLADPRDAEEVYQAQAWVEEPPAEETSAGETLVGETLPEEAPAGETLPEEAPAGKRAEEAPVGETLPEEAPVGERAEEAPAGETLAKEERAGADRV